MNDNVRDIWLRRSNEATLQRLVAEAELRAAHESFEALNLGARLREADSERAKAHAVLDRLLDARAQSAQCARKLLSPF